MGRSQQATIILLRVALTDAFEETQQLQISGKRRLRIFARAQASPAEPPQHLKTRQKRASGFKESSSCNANANLAIFIINYHSILEHLKLKSFAFLCKIMYSQLSLSRLRLSRITAYLEEKIWSLLKHRSLKSDYKILWKRGEIASGEQFFPFSTIF